MSQPVASIVVALMSVPFAISAAVSPVEPIGVHDTAPAGVAVTKSVDAVMPAALRAPIVKASYAEEARDASAHPHAILPPPPRMSGSVACRRQYAHRQPFCQCSECTLRTTAT